MDLIVFEILDFDMILEMDFLGRNEANINCQCKKLGFTFENENQFKFGKGLIKSMMINTVKARKILVKGV